MFKKICYFFFVFFSNIALEAQNSPLAFEKTIKSYEVVDDSVASLLLDKVHSGAYVRWNTISYVIGHMVPHSKRILLIDSLLKIDYWDDTHKVKLIDLKQGYLYKFSGRDIVFEDLNSMDSMYIELTLQNQLLLKKDYYSSLISHAQWNFHMGKSYHNTFSELEKADSFYLRVLSVNIQGIDDSSTVRALYEIHERAMVGLLECARGSVYKLRNTYVPLSFPETIWLTYKSYLEELGEKVKPRSRKQIFKINGIRAY
jgi:hypothetical protein